MDESTPTCNESELDQLTLEEMIKAIELIPESPIEKFMKEKGFDPNKGDVMILPQHLWKNGLPSYVYKSIFTEDIILMKNPSLLNFKRRHHEPPPLF